MLTAEQVNIIKSVFAPKFSLKVRSANEIVASVNGYNRPLGLFEFANKIRAQFNNAIEADESSLRAAFSNEINAVLNSQTNGTQEELDPDTLIQKFIVDITARHVFSINRSMTEIQRVNDGPCPLSSDFDGLWSHFIGSWYPKHKCMYKCTESNEAIKSSLKEFMANAKIHCLRKIYEGIAYEQGHEAKANECLHRIYDYFKIEQDFDIFETLMKHWAWQVKRKMINQPVVWQIWINFFGATGIGKSYVVGKLCEPLDEFVSETSVSKLFDDTREVKRLTEKYILRMEEIAINRDGQHDEPLSADENNILKQILTQDKLDTRVYGTQEQSRKRITFSVISTANSHLYDTIYDETSMRRFFDFTCTAVKDVNVGYDEISKAYPLMTDFWKSVDENLTRGYWDPDSAVGAKIFKIQEKYMPSKTSVVNWINSEDIIIDPKGTEVGTDAYALYAAWCKDTNHKAKNMTNWIKEITKRYPDKIAKDTKIRISHKTNDEDTDVDVL